MLARLLTRYPTASLISELLQIHAGKFVVRSQIQVDGFTRATGLACSETLEVAEDRARSQALMVLLPEPSSKMQPEIPARYPTVTSEAQPVVKPSLPSDGAYKKQLSSFATSSEWNSSSYSNFSSVPMPKESALTPADLPKVVVENYGVPVVLTPLAYAEVTGEPNSCTYDAHSEKDEEVVIPFGDEEPTDSYDYSHESNIPAPAPAPEVNKRVNMTEAFAQTTTELKRLDWNTQQGRSYWKQTYGKTSRQQLTDNELLEFLTYLESQPTPHRLSFE